MTIVIGIIGFLIGGIMGIMLASTSIRSVLRKLMQRLSLIILAMRCPLDDDKQTVIETPNYEKEIIDD